MNIGVRRVIRRICSARGTSGILERIALKVVESHVESLSYWTSIDTRFRIDFQFLTRTCRALTITRRCQSHTKLAGAASGTSQRVEVSGRGTVRRGRTNCVSAFLAELSLWIAGAVFIRIQLALFDGLQSKRISTWTMPPKGIVIGETVGIVRLVAAKFAVRIARIARNSCQGNDAKTGVPRNRKARYGPGVHVSQSSQDGH